MSLFNLACYFVWTYAIFVAVKLESVQSFQKGLHGGSKVWILEQPTIHVRKFLAFNRVSFNRKINMMLVYYNIFENIHLFG